MDQIIEFLQKLSKNEDETIRKAAVICAGQVGEDAINIVIEALSDDDYSIRVAARESLGHIGGEHVIGILGNMLLRQFLIDDVYSVRALGRIGGKRVVEILEKALSKDTCWQIRREIIHVLDKNWCDKSEEILNIIVEKEHDKDVRRLARRTISKHKDIDVE